MQVTARSIRNSRGWQHPVSSVKPVAGPAARSATKRPRKESRNCAAGSPRSSRPAACGTTCFCGSSSPTWLTLTRSRPSCAARPTTAAADSLYSKLLPLRRRRPLPNVRASSRSMPASAGSRPRLNGPNGPHARFKTGDGCRSGCHARGPADSCRSFDRCPGDRGWLAAGKKPAGRGRGQRPAADREGEVEERDVAQVAEVVVVDRHEDDVGGGDSEERAEEGKRAGGGGGQLSADPGGGSGCGQRAEVAGAFTANQPDRQREDAERQEGARPDRERDHSRVGGLFSSHLDRESRIGRECAGVRDLVARQGPAQLEEPAGRDLPPAAAAKTVKGDECWRRARGRRIAGVAGPEEALHGLDPLDVRDRELLLGATDEEEELVGRDPAVGEEVRVLIDLGRVDSEVPEHGGRGDIDLGFGRVVVTGPAVESPREL